MQEEDSNNPYGFLRAGLHSEDNGRSDNFEAPNLESLGQKQDSISEQMDPHSDSQKEPVHQSAK